MTLYRENFKQPRKWDEGFSFRSAPGTGARKASLRTSASGTFDSLPPTLPQCCSALGGRLCPPLWGVGAGNGGAPCGRQRALPCRWVRPAARACGLAWAFVLFQWQRFLLTPFPNMLLVSPVSLPRAQLKKKKRQAEL